MIVKIKNEENCWSYFEGDSIVQHTYGNSEGNGTVAEHRDDTIYFIDRDIIKEKGNLVISFYITKDKKVINRVNTNQPTYLLNDNGKTIDKLI